MEELYSNYLEKKQQYLSLKNQLNQRGGANNPCETITDEDINWTTSQKDKQILRKRMQSSKKNVYTRDIEDSLNEWGFMFNLQQLELDKAKADINYTNTLTPIEKTEKEWATYDSDKKEEVKLNWIHTKTKLKRPCDEKYKASNDLKLAQENWDKIHKYIFTESGTDDEKLHRLFGKGKIDSFFKFKNWHPVNEDYYKQCLKLLVNDDLTKFVKNDHVDKLNELWFYANKYFDEFSITAAELELFHTKLVEQKAGTTLMYDFVKNLHDKDKKILKLLYKEIFYSLKINNPINEPISYFYPNDPPDISSLGAPIPLNNFRDISSTYAYSSDTEERYIIRLDNLKKDLLKKEIIAPENQARLNNLLYHENPEKRQQGEVELMILDQWLLKNDPNYINKVVYPETETEKLSYEKYLMINDKYGLGNQRYIDLPEKYDDGKTIDYNTLLFSTSNEINIVPPVLPFMTELTRPGDAFGEIINKIPEDETIVKMIKDFDQDHQHSNAIKRKNIFQNKDTVNKSDYFIEYFDYLFQDDMYNQTPSINLKQYDFDSDIVVTMKNERENYNSKKNEFEKFLEDSWKIISTYIFRVNDVRNLNHGDWYGASKERKQYLDYFNAPDPKYTVHLIDRLYGKGEYDSFFRIKKRVMDRIHGVYSDSDGEYKGRNKKKLKKSMYGNLFPLLRDENLDKFINTNKVVVDNLYETWFDANRLLQHKKITSVDINNFHDKWKDYYPVLDESEEEEEIEETREYSPEEDKTDLLPIRMDLDIKILSKNERIILKLLYSKITGCKYRQEDPYKFTVGNNLDLIWNNAINKSAPLNIASDFTSFPRGWYDGQKQKIWKKKKKDFEKNQQKIQKKAER